MSAAVAPPGRTWRVELSEGLPADRDEWSALTDEHGTIFQTPEWVETWARHFAPGKALHIVTARDDVHRLRAVIALSAWSERPWRVLRFAGHGPADCLGPVCAAGDRKRVARLLRETARKLGGRVLLAEQIPAGAGWDELLGGRVMARGPNLTLPLEQPDFADVSAGWSRSFARKIGRDERRLDREHEVRWRHVSDPGDVERDFGTLFALHEARWGTESSLTADRAFQFDFARVAARRGWLRLTMLEVDGRPVAAVYNLRFGRGEHQYNQGRDPGFERIAIGMLALTESIRGAHRAGVESFCFGRGGEEYKRRFTSNDPGLMTLAVPVGTTGRAAVRMAEHLPRSAIERVRRRAHG